MEYFNSVFPVLADRQHSGVIFFAIKANLRKEHVAVMARAGVLSVQPGVESLSTPALRLLRKGVTMLQNVQLLKWCAEYGIAAWWSFLVSFPGETNEHYTALPDLVPLLTHLTPPGPFGIHKVRFDRFSPFASDPAAFGIRNLRPIPAHGFVFPDLDEDARRDLTYFFAGDFDAAADSGERIAMLARLIGDWVESRESAALFSVAVPEALIIGDYRPCAIREVTFLSGPTRLVYEACDAICSPHALEAMPGLKDVAVQPILDALIADRLMLHENGAYLALAIPIGNGYDAPTAAAGKFSAACGGLIQGPSR